MTAQQLSLQTKEEPLLDALSDQEPSAVQSPTAMKRHNTPGVLQVLPALYSGGVERGTLEVASALLDEGWRSYVASEGGTMLQILERRGTTHFTLPLSSKNPLMILRNARALTKIIKENDIRLVHARSRAPAWSAWLAAKRCNIPFLTTFHGHYRIQNKFKRWYNGIMVRGERVIAISGFTADHVRDQYGVEEAKMRIIHRGVDLKVFDPVKVNQHRLVTQSQAWRVPDDLPLILMPGRLTSWKGQEQLIHALSRLQSQEFFCIIAGHEGAHRKYRHRLEDLVMELDLGSKVRIVTPTLDMPAAYLLARVVVVPSLRPEAFGRVAAEAGSMGRPVVAYDHGGARETVVPGVTGWLVQPGDTDRLAQALDEALRMPSTAYDTMGSDARAHVSKHFALTEMCRKTLDVYRELVK